MKKNIFLTMAVAVALCMSNSTVATIFHNMTQNDIRVIGFGGSGWDIKKQPLLPVRSFGLPQNQRRFESGLRDNLVIKIADVFIKEFNLKLIKNYMSVKNAYLHENFTLTLEGKMRGNAQTAYSNLKDYCDQQDQNGDKRCRVTDVRVKTGEVKVRSIVPKS